MATRNKAKEEEEYRQDAGAMEEKSPPSPLAGESQGEGEKPAADTGKAPALRTDYCILVNKSKQPLACPLRDGTHINLGPRCAGRDIHVSGPILKKLLTKQIFAWEKLGWIERREYAGGE